MGTIFRATIEGHDGRAWRTCALFELGKAYDVASEIEWRGPITPGRSEPEHVRRGFIFSRCPECAGNIGGEPGAYYCTGTRTPVTPTSRLAVLTLGCGARFSRPGRYNEAGEKYDDVPEPEPVVPVVPLWQAGEADRYYEYEVEWLLRGVASLASVNEANIASAEIAWHLFRAAVREALSIEKHGSRMRAVLWADQ